MTSMESEIAYALGYLDSKVGSVDDEPKIDKEVAKRIRDLIAKLAGHDT